MELSSSKAAYRCLLRKAKKDAICATSKNLLDQFSSYDADNLLAIDASKQLDLVNKILGAIETGDTSGLGWEMLALSLLLIKESNMILRELIQQNIIPSLILRLLDHAESRIRQLCVELIAIVAQELRLIGKEIYPVVGPELLVRINDKFIRSLHTKASHLGGESIVPLDDSAGWSSLESSMLAYHEVIRSSSIAILIDALNAPGVTDLLITRASVHQNRFVREASISMVNTICTMISDSQGSESASLLDNQQDIELALGSKMTKHWGIAKRIAPALKLGLQDNWSRIRQASSLAAQSFLSSLCTEEDREKFWPILLPCVCLNRFYAAEGVKTTALNTWQLLVGSKGRDLVETHIESFITTYTEMSKANNHMISEAACSAIAEILCRIDRNAVFVHLDCMVQALGSCLKDDSWPVRDSSCVATGHLLRNYGEEVCLSSEDLISTFIDVCSRHLKDAIWSLRENAAIALIEALQSGCFRLKDKIIAFVETYLAEQLGAAYSRPTQKKVLSFLSPGQMAILDANAASGGKTISPISASSKDSSEMKQNPSVAKSQWRQGGGWGCCLDCMDAREGDSADVSSGAFYLFRELAGVHPHLSANHLETLWLLLEPTTTEANSKKSKLQMAIIEQLPQVLEQVWRVVEIPEKWLKYSMIKV